MPQTNKKPWLELKTAELSIDISLHASAPKIPERMAARAH
jgi:hypothetical protein